MRIAGRFNGFPHEAFDFFEQLALHNNRATAPGYPVRFRDGVIPQANTVRAPDLIALPENEFERTT
jgi:hypothetical protein